MKKGESIHCFLMPSVNLQYFAEAQKLSFTLKNPLSFIVKHALIVQPWKEAQMFVGSVNM